MSEMVEKIKALLEKEENPKAQLNLVFKKNDFGMELAKLLNMSIRKTIKIIKNEAQLTGDDLKVMLQNSALKNKWETTTNFGRTIIVEFDLSKCKAQTFAESIAGGLENVF